LNKRSLRLSGKNYSVHLVQKKIESGREAPDKDNSVIRNSHTYIGWNFAQYC